MMEKDVILDHSSRYGACLEVLAAYIIGWQAEKKTGKLIFEINFNQGGIGDLRVKTEKKEKVR